MANSEPRRLSTVNSFCKKLHLRCLTGFGIRFRLTVTYVKFRKFLKDGVYENQNDSDDYSFNEEGHFLVDINGELVRTFSKKYFC